MNLFAGHVILWIEIILKYLPFYLEHSQKKFMTAQQVLVFLKSEYIIDFREIEK